MNWLTEVWIAIHKVIPQNCRRYMVPMPASDNVGNIPIQRVSNSDDTAAIERYLVQVAPVAAIRVWIFKIINWEKRQQGTNICFNEDTLETIYVSATDEKGDYDSQGYGTENVCPISNIWSILPNLCSPLLHRV